MYLPSSFEMAAPNFICPICVCIANALLVTSTTLKFMFSVGNTIYEQQR